MISLGPTQNHLRRVVKGWLPPEGLRLLRHAVGRGAQLRGTYSTWEAASAGAEGYSADQILTNCERAATGRREGRGAFDRDGVLFEAPEYPFPLLACLLRAAARDGRLHVIDFGGALGSTYWQCRDWLDHVRDLKWHVVEQPNFVAAGNARHSDQVISFHPTIADAAANIEPNVAVLSGVLQYIPDPDSTLQDLQVAQIPDIVIDRTPVITSDRERFSRQHISKPLTPSAYPIRLFTRRSLLDRIDPSYRLLAEFDAVDDPMGGLTSRVEFKGFAFSKSARQSATGKSASPI